MKTALIMEGGAMRGLFTCGVMDILMENNITFDGGAGISAGAVFGCNYKSHQPGRPLRYNLKYGRDPRFASVRSLLKTGDFYGADFCYRELPDVLDVFDRETFAGDPMEFYVGATDIMTGEAVFHKCTDGGEEDIQWMRASASMPLVSRIVKIGDYQLLDGGIACSVPFRYMESLGYNRNVIILTQPLDYVKKKSAAVPLIRLTMRKYPAVIRAMEKRHDVYNEETAEVRRKELAGEAIVIRPPESLHISRTENDPKELVRVYDTGRKAALQKLDEIKAFLVKDSTDDTH